MKLVDAWHLLVLLLVSSGARYLTRRGTKLVHAFKVRLQRLAIFWFVLSLIGPYINWDVEMLLAAGLGFWLG